MFDPLVHSTLNNPLARTVFDSPGLKLISLPWPWVIALKLQRFTPEDQMDISAILRFEGLLGNSPTNDGGVVKDVEETLKRECPAMEYEHFPDLVLVEWRMRLLHCVRRARFGYGYGDVVGQVHGRSRSAEADEDELSYVTV
jgi:hypothetical protein